MTFYDGKTILGSSVTPVLGVATLTTSSLTVGTHAITASYSGDKENSSSVTSDVLEQAITGNFTVTVNAVSGALNQSITIPATLQ